ncbi:hypothetical protein AB1207_14380 [Kineococcus endophyticus]|uniref:Uncharacterized protein n=1 Tax=Kineococcus endophyticus TaxID=1181883 RepID=A0ABV3P8G5_9ACTN
MTRTADWARDHLVVLVQPDGDLALWSTGGRTLVLRDATEEQVTEHLVARTLSAPAGEAAAGGSEDPKAERRALQAARWAVKRARQGLQPRVHLPRWEDVAVPGRA